MGTLGPRGISRTITFIRVETDFEPVTEWPSLPGQAVSLTVSKLRPRSMKVHL